MKRDEQPPTLSLQELTAIVTGLQVEVQTLKGQVDNRDTTIDSLRETIVGLTHENELYKRRLYGNKTERFQTSELQLSLGDLLSQEGELKKQLDATVNHNTASNEAESSSDPKREKSRPTPKGRRDLSTSKLPRVLVEILDEALEKTARRIGFDESSQVMFRPGGYAILVKRVAKYEVPGSFGPTVATVPSPRTLFPGGLLHASAVAQIIVQKFALGVPHYRLEQHLQEQGVELYRSMMSRYTEDAGNTLGATIVAAMWNSAVQNSYVISTDATSAMIQPVRGEEKHKQACKKGHFFTAVADCDYVLFAYTENHTQAAVQALFGDFHGYLQSDASNVYDILDRGPPTDDDEGVTLVGCWAHCRRYFFEAAICHYAIGLQGLMRIRAMYAIDNQFAKLPPSKRKELRQQQLAPLVKEFFEWVRASRNTISGRNLATKALGYASNQEQELIRVLDDGRLPLDNTRAERALRKVVVGRKAWMFYGSDTHAESAAALFTIIATCRLHRVEPEQYLDEVLRLLPYWPQDRYLELSPKHWSVTRSKLREDELKAYICSFTIPYAA